MSDPLDMRGSVQRMKDVVENLKASVDNLAIWVRRLNNFDRLTEERGVGISMVSIEDDKLSITSTKTGYDDDIILQQVRLIDDAMRIIIERKIHIFYEKIQELKKDL